ncbi:MULTISPECIES: poly-beta-1,6-N-acetyl-D-glucosamine biosynthesis protein PgaD [Luteimonas]|uniref:poly-beta-1,6-N-acetyl-D-glucosamine biosynthesis protein PgaD n=1 Tax=Luteimonas TaxID=83614 RepID=UPI000C7A9771|nr:MULTISPECIES: poly-beta-1,6-N-acetyl-D-glucosamine biosynthesis protein PgaD [Luteimonas]
MTPPIIDHSRERSRGRRTAASMLTAAAWGLYAWLWVPLITLLAWFLGVRTAYVQLYMTHNVIDPFLLLALPIIAVGCAILLIAWAEYNRARFGKRDRRGHRPDIDDDAVRTALGATALLAGKLRGARIVTVSVDEDARPIAATRPGEM